VIRLRKKMTDTIRYPDEESKRSRMRPRQAPWGSGHLAMRKGMLSIIV